MIVRLLATFGTTMLLCLFMTLPAMAGFTGSTYKSSNYAFSITLPDGWEHAEYLGQNSLTMVEARSNSGLVVSVNVSPQIQDVSFNDDYLICEQMKDTIETSFGGYNIKCLPVKTGGRKGHNILYLRRTALENLTCQFVNQIVISRNGYTYTLTSYALGVTEEEALNNYAQNTQTFYRTLSSFWLY